MLHAEYDWRTPNRKQIGDAASAQILFMAYVAVGEECDIMICALKLIVNLVRGNKFGLEVRGLLESRKRQLADASATFISVDNVRASVTMVELWPFKEVHEVVLPKFSKEFTEA